MFPISRDPPEGGTSCLDLLQYNTAVGLFPISRDPPEGGTCRNLRQRRVQIRSRFPISRDPPEGGTVFYADHAERRYMIGFQFLGIPPKGELALEASPVG
jgi:hypothetical protein